MAGADKNSDQLSSVTKSFDQYEYVAVITPGATLLLGLAFVLFEHFPWAADKDVSLGLLGIFLIAAYVTGQFVRAIGDGVQFIFWKCFGGMPTDWVIENKRPLLDDSQRGQLQDRLRAFLNENVALADFSGHLDKWQAVTRRLYAIVSGAQRSFRIDAFNRSYGMMIGLTVALFVLGIFCWAQCLFGLPLTSKAEYAGALALTLSILTLGRAYVFAKSYGRELFVEFLELPPERLRPASSVTDNKRS